MKLQATINPYNAGTKSPIFLIAGEKTVGKVMITEMYPIMQMNEIIFGRSSTFI